MYTKTIVNAIKSTTVLAMVSSLNVSAATCDINASVVQAHYTIEAENTTEAGHTLKLKDSANNKHTHQVKKTELTLIRNKTQVAYVYPVSNVTDVWLKYPNNQVTLNRYFEEQKRVIEYQPNELKRAVDWQKKYQLITPTQIKELNLITKVGNGCYQQEEYHLKKDNIVINLSWLPQLNLVERLQISQQGHTKTWQLHNVESSEDEVKQFFAKHYQYQSTDYADIGDNESDPFLVKMINLGFVDHSPQGFYNSQGDNISPDHHRH